MKICVFCGSNPGKDPIYQKEAKFLALEMANKNIGLVYGGATVGIMGLLADTVMGAGGKVYGVIPRALIEKEVAHRGITELHEVTTMHERKKLMYDLSDAFISLPGGFGTLDETFEILTWKQIGIHRKPLILVNINGYYDGLIHFIDQAVSAGFIRAEHRALLMVADSAQEALRLLS